MACITINVVLLKSAKHTKKQLRLSLGKHPNAYAKGVNMDDKTPQNVLAVMGALDEAAKAAGCYNSFYIERNDDGTYVISCNYERYNIMLAYDPVAGKWFYQQMYGGLNRDTGLALVGGRPSRPMAGGHDEAMANANLIYRG